LNDIEIALRDAHFRYRRSIEYRDTRAGIVIVVPISGIAQHYWQQSSFNAYFPLRLRQNQEAADWRPPFSTRPYRPSI